MRFTSFGLTALVIVALAAIQTSCTKVPGHSLTSGTTTTTTKTASITWLVKGTTYTLSTSSADTVLFSNVTSPTVLTTVRGSNAGKTTVINFTVPANSAGTYNMSSFSTTIPYNSSVLTTSTTNKGTVTINSMSLSSGVMAGTFSTVVQMSATASDTTTVTGTFSIQQ